MRLQNPRSTRKLTNQEVALEKKRLEKEVVVLGSNHEALKKKIADGERKSKKLESVHADLKAAELSLSVLKKEIKSGNTELSSLQKKIAVLKKQFDALTESLKSAKEIISRAEKLKVLIPQFERNKQAVIDSIAELREDQAEKEKEARRVLKDLNDQMVKTSAALGPLKAELDSLIKECEVRRSELIQLNKESSQLQSSIAGKRTELADMESDRNALVIKNRAARKEYNNNRLGK